MIDLVATLSLLVVAYGLRADQPALAGLVVGASVAFWLTKNAKPPTTSPGGPENRAEA